MEDDSRKDGESEVKPLPGDKERIVISFDDEPAGGDEPTEVLGQVPERKPRAIIFADDPVDPDYDEDELEDDEFDDDPGPPPAVAAPAVPKAPGIIDRLGIDRKQLTWLAVGTVAGLLLVSMFTVYAVTSWTGLLPEPQVGKVGAKGEDGRTGPVGFRGKQGKRGHEGTQGPQGPMGPEGSDGVVIIP